MGDAKVSKTKVTPSMQAGYAGLYRADPEGNKSSSHNIHLAFDIRVQRSAFTLGVVVDGVTMSKDGIGAGAYIGLSDRVKNFHTSISLGGGVFRFFNGFGEGNGPSKIGTYVRPSLELGIQHKAVIWSIYLTGLFVKTGNIWTNAFSVGLKFSWDLTWKPAPKTKPKTKPKPTKPTKPITLNIGDRLPIK